MLDWGSAWSKITTAATSGEGPDISQLGTTWVAAIAAMGALRPFTAEEIAAMGGAENFVEASWQTCNPVGSGFTVAIPWFVDTRAIIYRKDVLEKVGLDPDEAFATWDSFDAALARIKEAREAGEVETYPIGFPGKNDWNVLHNFAPWVWGAGGEMLNPGNTAAVFNSPEAIEGFKFYASLFTKGYTPPDVLELNSAQVDGMFPSGEVAMIISGPWMVKNSRTSEDEGGFAGSVAAENFAVHEIPAGPAGRFTFVGGSDLTVWNSSQHQEEAVEFVKFLVSKESQIRYGGNIGMLPAVKEALADPTFKDDPDYGVFVQAVEHGKSYPAIAAWGPLESAMVKNLGALWDVDLLLAQQRPGGRHQQRGPQHPHLRRRRQRRNAGGRDRPGPAAQPPFPRTRARPHADAPPLGRPHLRRRHALGDDVAAGPRDHQHHPGGLAAPALPEALLAHRAQHPLGHHHPHHLAAAPLQHDHAPLRPADGPRGPLRRLGH
ncbi:MAG: extracellular solute-binding protein [Chloroflexi bacterium]|nr:MAG: extracellular solute-binding protein [Chloroflexota bacterium]